MFGFFKKKNNLEKQEDDTRGKSDDKRIEDFIKRGWLRFGFSSERKNLLIMDDSEEIISSIIDDLHKLNSTTNFNINDFNIFTISSKMAGFDVLELLEVAPEIRIDFALLDIILGGKKVVEGVRKMIDGVDVAISIWTRFPNAEILFFSGCIIEQTVDKNHFKSRFEKFTSEKIDDYIIPKDADFSDELDQLSRFFIGY